MANLTDALGNKPIDRGVMQEAPNNLAGALAKKPAPVAGAPLAAALPGAAAAAPAAALKPATAPLAPSPAPAPIAAAAVAAPAKAAAMTPAQAGAAGLGWVPENHPLYGTAGYVGSTPAAAPGAAPGAAAVGAGTALSHTPAAIAAPAPTAAAAPQIGMGNTADAAGRVQAPGLTTPGAPAAAAPPNPQAEMQTALRSQIMGMLGTDVTKASATDADIAPESQAFSGAMERQTAGRRAEMALKAGREGWADSGGFDQRLDAMAQESGAAVGANDAALVAKKLEGRKTQLNSAMAAAQSMGMDEEANNLKRQLANLDASVATSGQDVTREQTGVSRDVANLDASTRMYLGDLNAKMQTEGLSSQERLAKLDAEAKKYGIDVQGKLGELDAALRGQLGNRQIDLGYDQLGVNVAKTQADYNRDAVIAGMG